MCLFPRLPRRPLRLFPSRSAETPPVDNQTPFAFADFTWMNAVPRNHDSVLDGKYFSGEFRVDTNYIYDYNHPIDHTLSVARPRVRERVNSCCRR